MTSTPGDYSPSWDNDEDDGDTPSAAWSALTDYDNDEETEKEDIDLPDD